MSSLKSQIRKHLFFFIALGILAMHGGSMVYLLSLFISISLADFGILKLKGTVTYCSLSLGNGIARNSVAIKSSDTIKDGTCIQSANGYIVIKDKGFLLSAKAPFSMIVSKTNPNLNLGKVRFKLEKIKDFKLQTRNAVVGVRGTDFFASYQPDLGETEVICFESEVNLSDLDGENKKAIPAGYWGGKGGRFGMNVTEPIKLEKNFLNAVKSDLAL